MKYPSIHVFFKKMTFPLIFISQITSHDQEERSANVYNVCVIRFVMRRSSNKLKMAGTERCNSERGNLEPLILIPRNNCSRSREFTCYESLAALEKCHCN
jgi:hypothetical protein